MNSLIIIATFLISLAIGIVVGMTIRKKIAESKIEGAEQEAKRLVELAKIEADVDKILFIEMLVIAETLGKKITDLYDTGTLVLQ